MRETTVIFATDRLSARYVSLSSFLVIMYYLHMHVQYNMCVFYNNIIAYEFFFTIISFICFSSFCPHRDTVALVGISHMYTLIVAAAHTTRWRLFTHVLYVFCGSLLYSGRGGGV